MTKSMPTMPWMARFFLFSLLLVLGACAGQSGDKDEARGSATSIITPRNTGAGEPHSLSQEELDKIQDSFQAMLNEASLLNVKEDYRSSLNIIQSAIAMNPPEPFGHRFRALEIRVRQQLLRKTYLDAFVRFKKRNYTIGEIIEGEIVLMNISDQMLVVPASRVVSMPDSGMVEAKADQEATEETRTMLRSVMTYREFIPSNTIITNRKTENSGIPEDIRLMPGEVFRVPVTVDSAEINVRGTMYRRYRLDCSLHAVEILVGNEVFHGSVQFKSASIGVFPRNAEHLADAPLERVKQSLRKGSPLHLTLAAAFVDPEDEKTVEEFKLLCLKELERPEGLQRMQDAFCCALSILADEENTRTKEEWTTWLRTRMKTR